MPFPRRLFPNDPLPVGRSPLRGACKRLMPVLLGELRPRDFSHSGVKGRIRREDEYMPTGLLRL